MTMFPTDLYDLDALVKVDAARGLDDGLDVLRDAGRSARLWDAWKERRLDAPQTLRLLDRVVVSASSAFNAVTAALAAGRTKLGGWFRLMRQSVSAHVFAGSLTVFGPGPAPADVDATAAAVGKQLAYLKGFRAALADGSQLLTGAEARAELYARAVHGAAQNLARAKAWRDGFKEERRILGYADHCPTCLEQAALKWQPRGVLTAIGDSECFAFCRCSFSYR